MIRFKCDCGKTLIANDELKGKAIKCPACHTAIRVPGIHHPAPTETAMAKSESHLSNTPHPPQAALIFEESTGRIMVDSLPTKALPLPFSVVVIQFAAWIEVVGSLFAVYIAFAGQLNRSESFGAIVLGCIGLLSCPFLFVTAYLGRTVHRLEEEILGPRTIVIKKSKAEAVKKVQNAPVQEKRLIA